MLLLFSLVAAVLLTRLPPPRERELRPRLLLLTGLGIAVLSFVLRLFFPLDSVQFGNAHLWQWGQCLGMFTLGVIAGRQGRLTRIPRPVRRACLLLTLAGIAAVAVLVTTTGDALETYAGGWNCRSLTLSVLPLGVLLSFALSHLLRRLPVLRRVV